MEPEIALVAAGVETEVDRRGLKLLDPAGIKEILAIHPRDYIKFQRVWIRNDTYEAARAIVEEYGGGYGMGLT